MRHLLMRRPHLRAIPLSPALPAGYELRTWAPDDDLDSLAATLTGAFQDEWSPERVRTSLTEAPDVRAVYAVFRDGKVVATASSRLLPERFPESGYVHWVGTVPEHARLGLASLLLIRLLSEFAERGCKDAVLETEDFRVPAIRTYLRLGFTPAYEVGDEDHRERWSAIFQHALSTPSPHRSL